jgi:hypothetical protein
MRPLHSVATRKMELKDQVCTIEQAIRLKELGVKQESIWSWYVTTDRDDTPSLNRSGYHCPMCGHPRAPYFAEVAAYTVSELGLMLPNAFNTMQVTSDDGRGNIWRGYDDEDKDCPMDKEYVTEAEARATMLIYLLENYLITAKDVNARLSA